MNFFPHNATFTRVAESIGAGGKLVEGSSSTVYDGECNVQTEGRLDSGLQAKFTAGVVDSLGSFRVFLPVSVVTIGLRPDDNATLNVSSTAYTGRVDSVDTTDNSCLVIKDD